MGNVALAVLVEELPDKRKVVCVRTNTPDQELGIFFKMPPEVCKRLIENLQKAVVVAESPLIMLPKGPHSAHG